MISRIEHRGYLFKIAFVGDSTTPVYRFRMYKPVKRRLLPGWKWVFVREERPMEGDIKNVLTECDSIIKNYKLEMSIWEVENYESNQIE